MRKVLLPFLIFSKNENNKNIHILHLQLRFHEFYIFCFLGTWHLTPPEEEKQGWRHIRLQQSGKNASGQTHYLSLSGLELYGSVIGVCDELGKAAKEAEQQLRRQRRLMRTHVLKHLVIGMYI